jgi:hypothetical protein
VFSETTNNILNLQSNIRYLIFNKNIKYFGVLFVYPVYGLVIYTLVFSDRSMNA